MIDPIRRTSLTVGDHTLTLEHYRAQSGPERTALRKDTMDRLYNLLREEKALWDQIVASVEEQFAPELAGVGKWLPPRATKSGVPDRRYRREVNPKWESIQHRKNDVLERLRQTAPRPSLRATYTWPYQLEAELRAWESAAENAAERFERLLSSTDWYSCYSDDHSVWAAGDARMQELQTLIRTLGPEAQRAFNRACPWLNEDGTARWPHSKG